MNPKTKRQLVIFVKLKLGEIARALLILFIIVVCVFLFVGLVQGLFWLLTHTEIIETCANWVLGILAVVLGLVILFSLYKGISDWIKSNWKKAGNILAKEKHGNTKKV